MGLRMDAVGKGGRSNVARGGSLYRPEVKADDYLVPKGGVFWTHDDREGGRRGSGRQRRGAPRGNDGEQRSGGRPRAANEGPSLQEERGERSEWRDFHGDSVHGRHGPGRGEGAEERRGVGGEQRGRRTAREEEGHARSTPRGRDVPMSERLREEPPIRDRLRESRLAERPSPGRERVAAQREWDVGKEERRHRGVATFEGHREQRGLRRYRDQGREEGEVRDERVEEGRGRGKFVERPKSPGEGRGLEARQGKPPRRSRSRSPSGHHLDGVRNERRHARHPDVRGESFRIARREEGNLEREDRGSRFGMRMGRHEAAETGRGGQPREAGRRDGPRRGVSSPWGSGGKWGHDMFHEINKSPGAEDGK